MYTSTRMVVCAATATLVLLAGCGSDNTGAGATADATTKPADTAAGTPKDAKACDTWIAADVAFSQHLYDEQGSVDSVNAALDAAIAAAPTDNAQTLTDLKAATQPQIADSTNDFTDDALTAYSDAVAWAGANCGVEKVAVTTTEFTFQGIPDTLTNGYTVVTLSNAGKQNHEMSVFKLGDDVTDSIADVLRLPPDQYDAATTYINETSVTPGQTTTLSWNLTPGRYGVFCATPAGSVGDTEGTGSPDFVNGMIAEFTVT